MLLLTILVLAGFVRDVGELWQWANTSLQLLRSLIYLIASLGRLDTCGGQGER
jgi:hypothetical protein